MMFRVQQNCICQWKTAPVGNCTPSSTENLLAAFPPQPGAETDWADACCSAWELWVCHTQPSISLTLLRATQAHGLELVVRVLAPSHRGRGGWERDSTGSSAGEILSPLLFTALSQPAWWGFLLWKITWGSARAGSFSWSLIAYPSLTPSIKQRRQLHGLAPGASLMDGGSNLKLI